MKKLRLYILFFFGIYGLVVFGQEAEAPSEPIEVPVQEESPGLMNETRRALQEVANFMSLDLGDNTTSRIIASFVILLLAFIAKKVISLVFANWLFRLAKKTSWKVDDQMIPAVKGPFGWLVLIIGFFLAFSVLSFNPSVDDFILKMFQAASMTIVFWGVLRVVDVLAEAMIDVARDRDMGVFHFIPLIKKAARTFLIVIAVILVIQNLGYSVGSLLAGLGIGGLAVALAAQESLGNFFGSISLVADRPFKVGDWIQVGNKVDGDVEEIGLRSTKVRTWSKSLLSIPNKVLANELIENWSKMPKRRVKQYVGVNYSTPPDVMDQIVEDIRQLLREDEGVQQDFILVNFTDFGESSLDILVYYFTTTTKWLEHMDVRQRINVKIMKAIEARGSSIAFPTRTINFEGEIAERLANRSTS